MRGSHVARWQKRRRHAKESDRSAAHSSCFVDEGRYHSALQASGYEFMSMRSHRRPMTVPMIERSEPSTGCRLA